MEDQMLEITQYCMLAEIFIFNIIGVFGNIQLLWTTCRKTLAQTKSGILLAITAFFHTICLLSELVNAVFILSEPPHERRKCYSFIVIYILAMCAQALMTLVISVDLLIALIFPVRYRMLSKKPYVVLFVSLCTSYGLLFAVWGWLAQDDELILFCNPPLALSPAPDRVLIISNNCNSCLVVIVYAAMIIFVKIEDDSEAFRTNHQIVRRLQIILLVYICSWFTCSFGINILRVFDFSEHTVSLCLGHFVLFPLICYSQTFYVCIWRSKEYRAAFKEQLWIMCCYKTRPLSNTSRPQTPALFTRFSHTPSRSLQ